MRSFCASPLRSDGGRLISVPASPTRPSGEFDVAGRDDEHAVRTSSMTRPTEAETLAERKGETVIARRDGAGTE